jgi:long-chain acyl-CoA synthetase
MMEYYNDQDTTNEVLKKHKDGKIWMHSGDLGYMNKDGSIFLKGRLKRMIPRYDGIKISPLDIEHAIEHNQYVAKCCVVGVTDKEHSNGEIPVAYIVLKDNIKESDNEIFDSIMNSCKEKLSDNYLPKDFQIIEDLPLTSVGKVDYRSLINDYNNKCLVKR